MKNWDYTGVLQSYVRRSQEGISFHCRCNADIRYPVVQDMTFIIVSIIKSACLPNLNAQIPAASGIEFLCLQEILIMLPSTPYFKRRGRKSLTHWANLFASPERDKTERSTQKKMKNNYPPYLECKDNGYENEKIFFYTIPSF